MQGSTVSNIAFTLILLSTLVRGQAKAYKMCMIDAGLFSVHMIIGYIVFHFTVT